MTEDAHSEPLLAGHNDIPTCKSHPAPATLYCLDHEVSFCPACFHEHMSDQVIPWAQLPSLSALLSAPQPCPAHPNNLSIYLCVTDAVLLCEKCKPAHKSHQTLLLLLRPVARLSQRGVDGYQPPSDMMTIHNGVLPVPSQPLLPEEEKSGDEFVAKDGEVVCLRHQKPLVAFCNVERVYICQECKEGLHKGHDMDRGIVPVRTERAPAELRPCRRRSGEGAAQCKVGEPALCDVQTAREGQDAVLHRPPGLSLPRLL